MLSVDQQLTPENKQLLLIATYIGSISIVISDTIYIFLTSLIIYKILWFCQDMLSIFGMYNITKKAL